MRPATLRPATLPLALAALIATLPLAADAQTGRDAADWSGRYFGTIPCADCPGIEMDLSLSDGGVYALAETYLDAGTPPTVTEGVFSWDASGTVITLEGDGRKFRIDKTTATMLGADGTPGGPDYTLTEADVFVSPGQQLVVLPGTDGGEAVDDAGKAHVSFTALHNFDAVQTGGYRSMHVTYDINCTDKTFETPGVAYFEKPDAQGALIDESQENTATPLPLPAGDDVLTKAARAYCPAG